MGEIYDKGSLSGCAVTLTGAIHARKAPNEEFQFDPALSQFNSEDEGLARCVLNLNVA